MNPEELLEAIVKILVENSDAVRVTREMDAMGVLLRVKVADEDAGLVIGRQGSTAQAIKLLMKNIGMRKRERISVRIDVPERKPSYAERHKEDPRPRPRPSDVPTDAELDL